MITIGSDLNNENHTLGAIGNVRIGDSVFNTAQENNYIQAGDTDRIQDIINEAVLAVDITTGPRRLSIHELIDIGQDVMYWRPSVFDKYLATLDNTERQYEMQQNTEKNVGVVVSITNDSPSNFYLDNTELNVQTIQWYFKTDSGVQKVFDYFDGTPTNVVFSDVAKLHTITPIAKSTHSGDWISNITVQPLTKRQTGLHYTPPLPITVTTSNNTVSCAQNDGKLYIFVYDDTIDEHVPVQESMVLSGYSGSNVSGWAYTTGTSITLASQYSLENAMYIYELNGKATVPYTEG